MRSVSALAVQFLVFAAMGCFTVSDLDHVPTPTPVPPDRQDCGAILGTAFRSSTEQTWFAENCSAWAGETLGRVEFGTISAGQQTGGAQNPPAADGGNQDARDRDENDEDERRCNEQRGRPYASPEDRQWYRQHCLDRPANNQDTQNAPNNQNDRNGRAGEDESTEDLDCGQLAGRPYESPQQRTWYLANCLDQGASNAGAANQGGVGPDGRGCDQIYGTFYRSAGERSWFNQNCPH
jgi:hypothetical protein